MANTDDIQAHMKSNSNSVVEHLSTDAATNIVANSVASLTKNNESIEAHNAQVEAPLMRYFDLVEEANYSYVLGYN
ncbi:hypothetical protein [Colwellia psychrerythraea]|uniref:Uncharacterized protein n=1 Tax=Colwellia psychrerythraea TaxID=28229 RepID=A0A099KTS6_COLPS|nr:hypothetical protein [Colwellia psychrerythraea]KGJ93961.1 hypothetical protein GAB14E_2516 [Colwellia psychrerythraea]